MVEVKKLMDRFNASEKIFDVSRHSGRYPWDELWAHSSDELRRSELERLKGMGWRIEKIAHRLGTSVEEIEKYISD